MSAAAFKAAMFACAVMVLCAGYALDATSRLRDGRSGGEDAGDVIAAFQKPEFLAYVNRRQMQSDSQFRRVSVGDILPDSGVRFYQIPLPGSRI